VCYLSDVRRFQASNKPFHKKWHFVLDSQPDQQATVTVLTHYCLILVTPSLIDCSGHCNLKSCPLLAEVSILVFCS
jgi:hypothetical protein